MDDDEKDRAKRYRAAFIVAQRVQQFCIDGLLSDAYSGFDALGNNFAKMC